MIAQHFQFVVLQLVSVCSVDLFITNDIFAVTVWKCQLVWSTHPWGCMNTGSVSKYASKKKKNLH